MTRCSAVTRRGRRCKQKCCGPFKTCYTHSDDCPICLQKLGSGEVVDLPCGHYFHTECISKWGEHDHRCPTCRADIIKPKTLRIRRDVSAQVLGYEYIVQRVRDLYQHYSFTNTELHVSIHDERLFFRDAHTGEIIGCLFYNMDT